MMKQEINTPYYQWSPLLLIVILISLSIIIPIVACLAKIRKSCEFSFQRCHSLTSMDYPSFLQVLTNASVPPGMLWRLTVLSQTRCLVAGLVRQKRQFHSIHIRMKNVFRSIKMMWPTKELQQPAITCLAKKSQSDSVTHKYWVFIRSIAKCLLWIIIINIDKCNEEAALKT